MSSGCGDEPREGGEVLEGGSANRGNVVRIGNRVHRPRRGGADVVEALLLHLESVGFAGSPRFLGHDGEGRQVLSFIEGDVHADQRPPWIDDDEANALALGQVAGLLRELHDAASGFAAPAGTEPLRPLPLAGTVWNHADAHYGNTVWRGGRPVGLIDWEFSAPGDRMYDVTILLTCSRCPQPGNPDNARRERAALMSADAILCGYGATDAERASFGHKVATTVDDNADFMLEPASAALRETGQPDQIAEYVRCLRWQADWWRSRAD